MYHTTLFEHLLIVSGLFVISVLFIILVVFVGYLAAYLESKDEEDQSA